MVLAVQTEDGSRHQAEFSPSASLWDVLLELRLLQDRPPSLVGRSGVEQQQPVVVYMSHQVEGQAGLQDRTLRALGISSGRAVVRSVCYSNRLTQHSTLGRYYWWAHILAF